MKNRPDVDYIELGASIAREAGAIMLKHFRSTGIQMEWKEDNSPLSLADTAVNSMALQRLRPVLPDFSLLGEEGSLKVEKSDYTAVFDPVDGTFPFTNGIPTFVHALAFTHLGDPFACVVYDPILNRMFTAEKGKGAFLNGEQLHVNQKRLEPNTVVGMSWVKEQGDFADVQRHFTERSISTLQLLSSVYTGCLVATGSLAASIYPVKYPWDAACVKLLVEEAGGKVTNLTGEDQRYDEQVNGIIATNGLVHDEAVAIVKEKATIY